MQWRLKSPASPLFAQLTVQALIKENITAPRHWPLCGEFIGDPAQKASNAENVSIWWRHHERRASQKWHTVMWNNFSPNSKEKVFTCKPKNAKIHLVFSVERGSEVWQNAARNLEKKLFGNNIYSRQSWTICNQSAHLYQHRRNRTKTTNSDNQPQTTIRYTFRGVHMIDLCKWELIMLTSGVYSRVRGH